MAREQTRREHLGTWARLLLGAPIAAVVGCNDQDRPRIWSHPSCEGTSPGYTPFANTDPEETPTIAWAFPELFVNVSESFNGRTFEQISVTSPEKSSPGFGYREAEKRLTGYIKEWGVSQGYCEEDHECTGGSGRTGPPSLSRINRILLMNDVADPYVEAFMGGSYEFTATHLQTTNCLLDGYHGIIAIRKYDTGFGVTTNLLLLANQDHGFPYLADALTRIHELPYREAFDAHVVGIRGERFEPEVIRLID